MYTAIFNFLKFLNSCLLVIFCVRNINFSNLVFTFRTKFARWVLTKVRYTLFPGSLFRWKTLTINMQCCQLPSRWFCYLFLFSFPRHAKIFLPSKFLPTLYEYCIKSKVHRILNFVCNDPEEEEKEEEEER